ncbi:MAG: (Fe-S)-binding protein [bacterium]
MRTEFKKMMDYCTYCPKMCRFSCPAAEATASETYTPWGKMEIARWLTDKTLPLSEALVGAAYQCVNCLHCQRYCEHGNDVPSALREIRRMAVENYAAPAPVYTLEERFVAANNPYGLDLFEAARAHWPVATGKKPAEILFLPSCHTLHYFPERLATYFELFRKLGIEGVQVQETPIQCCGAPLDDLGFKQEFQEVAEVQYYSIKDYKWVVTDGPECCQTLKDRYSELGFAMERKSLHLMEFLAPYLHHSNYRSSGKIKGRLAYHDPSHLSRYLGLAELPRRILTELTGFAPLELSWNREDSLSSGYEGSYDLVFPEFAEKIALRTVEEVASRGLSKLLTADAKAEAAFRSLAKGFEVQDFFEFLNENILPAAAAAEEG